MISTASSNDSSTPWMAPSSSQLSWGLSNPSSSSSQAQKPPAAIHRAQSPNPRSHPGLSTTSSSSSQAPATQRAQSPNPRPSQLSSAKNSQLNTVGWGINTWEIGEGPSTPSSAVPFPAVMTKEEKALEMTRRKEERKQVCFEQASRGKISTDTFQRIAMLKEQKKAATKT